MRPDGPAVCLSCQNSLAYGAVLWGDDERNSGDGTGLFLRLIRSDASRTANADLSCHFLQEHHGRSVSYRIHQFLRRQKRRSIRLRWRQATSPRVRAISSGQAAPRLNWSWPPPRLHASMRAPGDLPPNMS